ncbi:hypothetical protein HRE53_30085 (plasmid) [Acaryochloris sp. 'Moss Beach']|uniref:CU044_2847 family protein n=1 Tax=Acaryochloris sp. 'Moss Beach' TaxID=2740837 RepID=UPI001F28D6DB|nr:CU044_2847 family protein [Acaryochloris sp. 'Moss Beach']UJB72984.1 hypothetical protein HRE53_30085 [Acaryochloris sp. 'Moss Beach']
MTQLAPIQLDDGTVIYIEAEDDVSTPSLPKSEGTTRTSKGVGDVALKNFQAMQGTIRTYTAYTLNAFKEVATANVDKVILEFGVKVAGEGGVPYITKGSGECNLKITVECSFGDREN